MAPVRWSTWRAQSSSAPSGRRSGDSAAGSPTFPRPSSAPLAIRAGLERAGLDPEDVGYVVMGQVLQAGAGQAPARQAAIAAGIPKEVPADTINKVCASSIRAIEIAELMIAAGRHDVVVTGGMESMSRAPYLLPKARFGYRMGNGEVLDHMVFDGLTSTLRRAAHGAAGVGRLARPRDLAGGPGRVGRALARAGGRRAGRRAVRRRDRARRRRRPRTRASAGTRRSRSSRRSDRSSTRTGRRPRATRPGVTDGGSCVVVCSEEWAATRGIEPLARILGHAYVAEEFAYIARTPAAAAERVLAAAGRAMDDVARVEINEAFASVAKQSTRMLGADEEIVNVNGGAVALGHPIGASGGRIVGTLVHELRRDGGGLGLAAICSGGGQGDAVLLEV